LEQLEASAKLTGIPRQIVADQGSDLKAGIEAFCQTHPTTSSIGNVSKVEMG
jgi:hypothetical protein